jgi:hypothetical protein
MRLGPAWDEPFASTDPDELLDTLTNGRKAVAVAEFDELTDDEIKWLEARLIDIEEASADDDVDDPGQVEVRDGALWFCAEESGDPRAVAEFVRDLLRRFRPNDSFSIGHAFSRSRLRIDGIGGAIFVAPERIEYLDTFALDCGRRRREIR